MDRMILTILIFLPFVAGILLSFFNKKAAKAVAFVFVLIEMCITIALFFLFQQSNQLQFVVKHEWLSDLGINYFVGVDGISILMVLLTGIIVPLIILSSWRKEMDSPKLFFGMILLMQGALMGVFLSMNAFMYYIFWELTLIPAYIILILWGGEGRKFITLKFFIYTLTGSVLMLIAFIFIYLYGAHSFDYDLLINYPICGCKQGFLFAFMMAAFMIKIPVFPLHTWQPQTYTMAPTAGTMLLSALMLKMGLYSILRWVIPILPYASQHYGDFVIVLSLIGVVYASVIAISQKNLKTLFAYSSMAHAGLIAAAFFSLNPIAIQGGLIQMFAHGIAIFGLFYIADIIQTRTDTNEIANLGGIKNIAPKFSGVYLVVLLSAVGLPLTAGFAGEFLMITGIFGHNAWMAAFAGLSIILSAVYMLLSYKAVMLGPEKSYLFVFKDLTTRELIIFAIVILIVFIVGLFPGIFLKLTDPSIAGVLKFL